MNSPRLVLFCSGAALAFVLAVITTSPVRAQPKVGKKKDQRQTLPGKKAVSGPGAPGKKGHGSGPGGAVTKAQRLPTGPHPVPTNFPKNAHFWVVKLDGEVSLGMAALVRRVARNLGAADVLLLEINTFGGRVDAAVAIRDVLIKARGNKTRTVVYINPRAISAGALISYAADVIVVAPAATMGASAPVVISEDGRSQPAGEKAVSYMRKEMRATAELHNRNGDIAEAMVDTDVQVPGLIDKGKLLTLDGKETLRWGIASFAAPNRQVLARKLGYSSPGKDHTVTEVQWSWAELTAGWLSSSMVSSLLMSIGVLGIMVGLYSGSTVSMVVGGVCLLLFFAGQYITALAGFEDVLLLVLGLVLVGVEALAPGNLVFGLAGICCVLAALFMGLVNFESVPFEVQWEAGLVTSAMAKLFGSFLVTALLGLLAFKLLPRSRFGRALVLRTAITEQAVGWDQDSDEEDELQGAEGVALSDLRPSGKVDIDGRRLDALSQLGYVDKGSPVRVVGRQGFHVVVAPIKEEP